MLKKNNVREAIRVAEKIENPDYFGWDQAYNTHPIVFRTVMIPLKPTSELCRLAAKKTSEEVDEFYIGLNGYLPLKVDTCIEFHNNNDEMFFIYIDDDAQSEVRKILDEQLAVFGQSVESLLERKSMNNTSVEQKKIEALGRMRELGIYEQTIQHFDKLNKISFSMPPVGAFFWIEGEDLKRVKDFERRYNALVYVAIRSYTDLGIMDSFLFVSDYQEEWEMDRQDLKNYEAIAFVYSHDAPEYSEIGSIGFELTSAAGLRRIW